MTTHEIQAQQTGMQVRLQGGFSAPSSDLKLRKLAGRIEPIYLQPSLNSNLLNHRTWIGLTHSSDQLKLSNLVRTDMGSTPISSTSSRLAKWMHVEVLKMTPHGLG
ncbi:hypothetical protein NC652_035356 [Populus alba x Populus x berolinensis]|nr:hypothetical protein NC652_035356 [Populus alba x Populus x berolinensis]